MRRHAAIPVYFVIRIASALVLLKLSAQFLTVRAFADFTQFLAFASLLNMAVVGGAQNGLIRQAAAATDAELADVHGAGLALWAAAVPLLGIPVALFSRQVSDVLTGSAAHWQVVIALAALSLAAGPGQVCWSVLSGRQRVSQSLGVQAFGVVTGTVAAAWFILRSNAVGAALAFAAGPLVATLAALPFAAQLPLRWRPTARGLLPLLGYSAAIASTLGFSALTLFALRWLYRAEFGATQLGYWLAANRISDMSTQFLGLFMLQAFVPQLATTRDSLERSRLIARYGLLGAALTGLGLLAMSVAGRPLVHLFLSAAYVPAIPSILLYMLGDFARVWVSLAMFTAFAAARPRRYAAMEISTMSVMAVLALLLMARHAVLAPQIGYVTAFALTALVLGTNALRRSGLPLRGSWRPRGERRTRLPNSVARLP